MAFLNIRLAGFLLFCATFISVVNYGEADIIDDVKALRPFELKSFLCLSCAEGAGRKTRELVMRVVDSWPGHLQACIDAEGGKSSLGCPIAVVGQACPEANPLFYFGCCGDLGTQCCFRLQDWVWILIIVLVLSVVVSIFVNLIRCMLCY